MKIRYLFFTCLFLIIAILAGDMAERLFVNHAQQLINNNQMNEDPLVYYVLYTYIYRPFIVVAINIILQALYKIITKSKWQTVFYSTVATSILALLITFIYIKIEQFALRGHFWP